MVNPYLKYTISSKLRIIHNNAFHICVNNVIYFFTSELIFQYSLKTKNSVKRYFKYQKNFKLWCFKNLFTKGVKIYNHATHALDLLQKYKH